jgi:hypothetical protein
MSESSTGHKKGEGGEEEVPDMAVSRAIVNSLEVNVVSDLPIASGVR